MTLKGDAPSSQLGLAQGVRRRLAAVLLLALVLPALALASHKDPKKQLNAADERRAASVLLKRSDFAAGWKKVPSTPDDSSHFDCPGYDPNGSDLILTGNAEADFERAGGSPGVYSTVDVYKTEAMARAGWARTVKPALVRCLAALFKKQFEGEGAKVAILRQGTLAFPKVAPRTAAFRMAMRTTFTENGETRSVTLTVSIVVVGKGRGEAGLLSMSVGEPIAVADLRAFAKLFAQRLAAAKL
jgi:hypothetical protein